MSGPAFYALGLLGHPLGHSRSPALHRAALQAAGLAGEYRLYTVPPGPGCQAELKELLARLRLGELHGLNVTIPHKQAVLPLLDELSPAAQACGAANTLLMQDGRLRGENTDAPGFWADLIRLWPALSAPRAEPRQALLLGAGGAARAAAYALLAEGWQVTVAARRPEQAAALADEFSPLAPGCISAAALGPKLARLPLDLLVNATPLGMSPAADSTPWPAGLPFPAGAHVYDLVYNPPETVLVRQARQGGLPAASGLGMLVEQAALSFELWTGVSVSRLALWHSVETGGTVGLPAR